MALPELCWPRSSPLSKGWSESRACVKQLETTLKESGGDRDLTEGEKAACNDAKQRALILGQ